MILIITGYINESELEPLKRKVIMEDIIDAAHKAASGLGIVMRFALLPKGNVLKKVKMTTGSGAARSAFLLRNKEDELILVMVRQKKDKKIGMNFSVSNPYFKKTLLKNLDEIAVDIDNGNYIEYEL